MEAFNKVAITPDNPKWEQCIKREHSLYTRGNDIRGEVQRDYTRLLHSQAFSRLKHKTQVFFAPTNDHVCTRMEHSLHVASVAATIARALSLDESLVEAISIGHDIGHSPFGHHGEDCLNALLEADKIAGVAHERGDGAHGAAVRPFWHERNSLFFVDYIECLADPVGRQKLLDLTYAVRDGIICHCGEIDQQGLRPRMEAMDLYDIKRPGLVAPYTWEGCVVRIADKISFLGRDIEDARAYHILDMGAYRELREIVTSTLGADAVQTGTTGEAMQGRAVNTTVLINDLIVDLCRNSSPENGLCFSEKCFAFLTAIRGFNLKRIYNHWRLVEFKRYASLVLGTLYHTLMHILPYVQNGRGERALRYCPRLCAVWEDWLVRHTNYVPHGKSDAHEALRTDAPKFFDVHDKASYQKCVIEFISGMTDQFAIRAYEEIISF